MNGGTGVAVVVGMERGGTRAGTAEGGAVRVMVGVSGAHDVVDGAPRRGTRWRGGRQAGDLGVRFGVHGLVAASGWPGGRGERERTKRGTVGKERIRRKSGASGEVHGYRCGESSNLRRSTDCYSATALLPVVGDAGEWCE